MTWSFPVGRILGTEVRIHATFFLLLLWIAVAGFLQGGSQDAIVSVLFILALFACVVLHEFGHALMARRYGIATPDITLLPIGGMARLERMPEKPAQEIAVALAGPAVNVAIWALIVLVVGATTDLEALAEIEDPTSGFWARLAAVNLFLVLFNLIPAFPMDGGRVFRALLSIWLGRVKATRVAAHAGQAVAFVFGFLALTTGNPLLLLIAVFVFVAAAAESSDVALRDMARELPARAAMITAYEALDPADGVDGMSSSLIRTTQHEFPVLGPDGRLRGFVPRQAIFAAVAGQRPGLTAAEAMVPDIPSVPLHAPLTKAIDALARPEVPAVAVTDAAGLFLGYITRENIGELMVLRGHRA
ncbi:site-2 protease family protein [Palleronia sp. KMU-117]|uniref:site-2 protease family protein n=1 Tax=Palleronia sp. KMU-117 TaxID=3434108 RepID=UPI003D75A92C